jgi:DNA-binding NtrC family response regulator
MERCVLVLDDNSGELGGLIKKLTAKKMNVLVCFSPEHALKEISVQEPQLLIAAGQFTNMSATQVAEKAYDARSIPSFVVLNSAGDETMGELRRHPGVIGTYFKPLNVDKVVAKVEKFFQTLARQ